MRRIWEEKMILRKVMDLTRKGKFLGKLVAANPLQTRSKVFKELSIILNKLVN
jgi:hypothetical protein